jgi:hypothetical protein
MGCELCVCSVGGCYFLKIHEEEVSRKKFEGEWDEWARRVLYKLVPWIS